MSGGVLSGKGQGLRQVKYQSEGVSRKGVKQGSPVEPQLKQVWETGRASGDTLVSSLLQAVCTASRTRLKLSRGFQRQQNVGDGQSGQNLTSFEVRS